MPRSAPRQAAGQPGAANGRVANRGACSGMRLSQDPEEGERRHEQPVTAPSSPACPTLVGVARHLAGAVLISLISGLVTDPQTIVGQILANVS